MSPSAPEATGAALRVGGFEPFSTTDWPGRLVAVVFVQGCPWRCGYCHNQRLQPRQRSADAPDWEAVRALLRRRQGLLDGVVFSGGEPTLDPALPEAVADVRDLGFAVGLHTSGAYPLRLAALLPRLDWVGLDLKATPQAYAAVTGVPRSGAPAMRSLALLAAGQVPFEVRTTGDADLLPAAALREMAALLARHGVRDWVLQPCRREGAHGLQSAAWPDADGEAALAAAGVAWRVRGA